MNDMDFCRSCRTPWSDHLGLVDTCRDLQAALSALRVISTWASFQDGSELVPGHVESLIKRTLEKIGGIR
ncbi:MAG: hypothetical protein ABIL06_13145 [Pseudomonadota bacterium]